MRYSKCELRTDEGAPPPNSTTQLENEHEMCRKTRCGAKNRDDIEANKANDMDDRGGRTGPLLSSEGECNLSNANSTLKHARIPARSSVKWCSV